MHGLGFGTCKERQWRPQNCLNLGLRQTLRPDLLLKIVNYNRVFSHVKMPYAADPGLAVVFRAFAHVVRAQRRVVPSDIICFKRESFSSVARVLT